MDTEQIETLPRPNGLIKTAPPEQAWIDSMSSHVDELDQDFRTAIQSNPFFFALCAVGAGVVAGLFFKKLTLKKDTIQ